MLKYEVNDIICILYENATHYYKILEVQKGMVSFVVVNINDNTDIGVASFAFVSEFGRPLTKLERTLYA